MADRPSIPDAGGSSDDVGTPRWVKVFGIAILAVVLLVIVMLLVGGGPGGHGPGRHLPSAGITEQHTPRP